MFMSADIVVKVVMVGLGFASLVTWTLLLAKAIELMGARRRAQAGLGDLARAQTLGEAASRMAKSDTVVGRLVDAALDEGQRSQGLGAEGVKERAAALLSRIEARAGRAMGRGTGLLATIGSTAPFVGLFGTVWGIMNAFIGISKTNTTNLAVVAPGIAEALLATATGLVAAIPAVIIYNMFARGITGYRQVLADASTEVLRLLSRDLDRGPAGSGITAGCGITWPHGFTLVAATTISNSTARSTSTPFIDVILGAAHHLHGWRHRSRPSDVNVDLPAATATPTPRPDKPVFVTLKQDDTLALGEDPIAKDALGAALDGATGGDKSKVVFVRADKAVSYGDVMGLMNVLRDAGYLKIGLVGLGSGTHDQAAPASSPSPGSGDAKP